MAGVTFFCLCPLVDLATWFANAKGSSLGFAIFQEIQNCSGAAILEWPCLQLQNNLRNLY
jgi:hypothetical protein